MKRKTKRKGRRRVDIQALNRALEEFGRARIAFEFEQMEKWSKLIRSVPRGRLKKGEKIGLKLDHGGYSAR